MATATHTFVFAAKTDAKSCILTGTFDNWGQTVHMERKSFAGRNPLFVAKVSLECGSRMEFKYVVDGEWLTDDTMPTVTDALGNTNNFILVPAEPSTPFEAKFVTHRDLLDLLAGLPDTNPDSKSAKLAGPPLPPHATNGSNGHLNGAANGSKLYSHNTKWPVRKTMPKPPDYSLPLSVSLGFVASMVVATLYVFFDRQAAMAGEKSGF